MAFDGVTVCAICHELRDTLTDGYIAKITEPEKDEVMLTVKTRESGMRKLLISAGASMPFICLTESNPMAPVSAPSFTMLLRKHLQGGRIISVEQPSLERVIFITVEHRDELGDLVKKRLVAEFMGKYSNVILTDVEDTVLDSVKRVPSSMSSVRTVLPGEHYFIPATQGKTDPLTMEDPVFFRNHLLGRPMNVIKALYGTYTGFSPVMATELCNRAGIDGNDSAASLSEDDVTSLYSHFRSLIEDMKVGRFAPEIVYAKGAPKEFAPVHLSMYEDMESRRFDSVSEVIERFYSERLAYNHIRQKSADLRKIVSNAIERTAKKYDLQRAILEDTGDMERYRVYAELINTYGYGVTDGSDHLDAVNFYDGKEVSIPLDPTITVHENANRYYARFEKKKRTLKAATLQAKESRMALEHLKSIEASFETAESVEDLALISEELARTGYIKKKSSGKKDNKNRVKSEPMHFVTSDGYDVYVGRNNIQNDELTFKMGKGNDWWFHSKTYPGSHVLMLTGRGDPMEVPDQSFNEAGRIAAFYSSGRDQSKVDIDYTLVKNVKKPAGSVPGYVIYHTNYSMTAPPDIEGISRH